MHLYAQVIVGIDELDEQRKLPRIYICNLLARIGAFAYNGLVARDTRKNPAFGAPDKSLEYRFKFVHSITQVLQVHHALNTRPAAVLVMMILSK